RQKAASQAGPVRVAFPAIRAITGFGQSGNRAAPGVPSGKRTTVRLIPLVLLAPLLLAPAMPARADAFTSAQRDEIVRIMRDALKQDPTILRDAIDALQADEGSRQEAAARSAI